MLDVECIGNIQSNFENLIGELNLKKSDIDYLNFSLSTKSSIDEFIKNQYKLCIENNEDVGTIGWDIFLPDRHFDKKHLLKIFDIIGNDFFEHCWVTRVLPGKMIPPIQDFAENFERWHCHLTDKNLGQIMFIGDTTLYNEQSGNLYKWKDSNLIYSVNNIGSAPQYFLNILTKI